MVGVISHHLHSVIVIQSLVCRKAFLKFVLLVSVWVPSENLLV